MNEEITITETWKILEAYKENEEITYVKWSCNRTYNGHEVPFGGEFFLDIPLPVNSEVKDIVDVIKLTLGDEQLNNIISHNENYAKCILYKAKIGNPFLVDEEEIRFRRNEELLKSDWTDLPNAPLTAAQKEQWIQYRQQLRDITNQSGFPGSVSWPTAPA